MNKYDYREAVTADILDYINEEIDLAAFEDRDQLEQQLNDDLWVCDSVTGNASGSYYCNAWKAEEALCHNLDLLCEALTEFGCGADYLVKNGAEAADVTIRCYLLGECIAAALDDLGVDA